MKNYYNDIPLIEYCKIKDYNYSAVLNYIKKHKDEKLEDVVDKYKPRKILYYKGVTLKSYCKENEICYNSVIRIIKPLMKENEITDSIIEAAIISIHTNQIKHYCMGIPLIDYCKFHKVNYSSVIHKYHKKYKDRDDITESDAFKEIVEHLKKIKRYKYKNMSLFKYLNNNNDYMNVYNSLKKYESIRGENFIIKKQIERNIRRKKIKHVVSILNDLEQSSLSYKEICKELKIDIDNIKLLTDLSFSIKQSIYIIWFYYDVISDDEIKKISLDKVKHILNILKKLEEGDFNNIELYDLVVIYKSDLYDTRWQICLLFDGYIRNYLNRYLKTYHIEIDYQVYDEICSNIQLSLYKFIDKIYLNNVKMIIKYICLYINGTIAKNIKEYNSKKIELVDKFINENQLTITNNILNPNMKKIFDRLSFDERKLIILKYYDSCSTSKISFLMNKSIQEVKLLESNTYKKMRFLMCEDEEYMSKISEYYKNRGFYLYRGIPLFYYCLKEKINSKALYDYIRKYYKENMNFDEFIDGYKYHTNGVKYYYKGIPLKEYCKENGINYETIGIEIREKGNDRMTMESIVENYNKDGVKYYYNGILLKDYCLEHNINYSTAIKLYNNVKEDLSLADIVKYLELKNNDKIDLKYLYSIIKDPKTRTIFSRLVRIIKVNTNEDIINATIYVIRKKLVTKFDANLINALLELSPKDQALFILRYYNNYDNKDSARILRTQVYIVNKREKEILTTIKDKLCYNEKVKEVRK